MSLPDIQIPAHSEKVDVMVEMDYHIFKRLKQEKIDTYLPYRRIIEKALEQYFLSGTKQGVKNVDSRNSGNIGPDGGGGIRRHNPI